MTIRAAQPVTAARRVTVSAKARTSDPASAFGAAHQAVMGTRDPKKAQEQLAAMKVAFDQLRQAGGRDLSGYQAKLNEATQRAAALPILLGVPNIPRPETLRNPESSSKGPTGEQAAQAKAWLNGYGASTVTGFKAWLYKIFPSLNKAEATPAFDKLPAAQKTQFLTVARRADAAGQVALHDMLVAGRLSPALLAELNGLATDRLDASVEQGKLLSQAIVELNDPVTISQHSRGTCAATSVQILTALEAPEQYVKLLRGLAGPQGAAKLGNGDVIQRESDWNVANDGGRSLSSRLLQPAFMEYANGELDYLNEDDMDLNPKTHEKVLSGLTAEQALTLLDASALAPAGHTVQGVVYGPELSDAAAEGLDATIEGAKDMLMVLQHGKAIDPASQDELMGALKRQASAKNPVYATVIYTLYPERGNVGFHAILVTGVKDGVVSYINPWGQEETLAEKDFRGSILSANVRK
jgi:hypothetical protein